MKKEANWNKEGRICNGNKKTLPITMADTSSERQAKLRDRQAKLRERAQLRRMLLAQQHSKTWIEKCVRIFTGIAATRWADEVALPLRCCCRQLVKAFDLRSPTAQRNAVIAFHDFYLVRGLVQPFKNIPTSAFNDGLKILTRDNAKELWSQGFTIVPQFATLETIKQVAHPCTHAPTALIYERGQKPKLVSCT